MTGLNTLVKIANTRPLLKDVLPIISVQCTKVSNIHVNNAIIRENQSQVWPYTIGRFIMGSNSLADTVIIRLLPGELLINIRK